MESKRFEQRVHVGSFLGERGETAQIGAFDK